MGQQPGALQGAVTTEMVGAAGAMGSLKIDSGGPGRIRIPPCKATMRVRAAGGEKNKRAGHRSGVVVKDKWRLSGAYSFLDPLLVAGIGRRSQLSPWACIKPVTQ